MKGLSAKGFTLIELMLVVAIIGLLAAIAIPKFADLVRKSKEAAVRGNVGTFRSAFSIYFADNEGIYPAGIPNFQSTLIPKYMKEYTVISVPFWHAGNRGVGSTWHVIPDGGVLPFIGDTQPFNIPFYYCPPEGNVYIACTHTDVQGRPWSMQ